MDIGVIIIFRNSASALDAGLLIKQARSADFIKFCFVDNNSKDATLELLHEIKQGSQHNVEIVEIKKVVSEPMAKRAGARYLFNNYNLKYTGYINSEALAQKGKDLPEILAQIIENKQFIEEIKTQINSNRNKQSFFKKIFSIVDSLKDLNENYGSLRPSL